MRKVDIRAYKNSLRDKAKKMRRDMDQALKAKMDEQIAQRLYGLYQYREADTILCYVSKPIEVNTIPIIEQALRDGKQVACPRCVEGTRQMEFYLIRSLNDLEKRTFGVLEPKVPECQRLLDFSGSICIVPALMYDLKGYRLGYGGGYYDRFLSGYDGFKIGVTYRRNILRFLHYGRFDVPVDLIVTESFFRVTDRSRLSARES